MKAEDSQDPGASGVRGLFARVRSRMGRHDATMLSAGVTFFVVRGVLPGLGALAALYGLLADPARLGDQLRWLSFHVPPAMLRLLGDEMRDLAGADRGWLTVAFFMSVALALWSGNAAVRSLLKVLNTVNEVEETRPKSRLFALGFSISAGGLLLMFLAAGVIVGLPLILKGLGVVGVKAFVMRLAASLLFFMVMFAGAMALYRLGPNRSCKRPGGGLAGALLFAGAWLAASVLLAWFVSDSSDYSATHATLAVAFGFLLWVYAAVLLFLFGAELEAVRDLDFAARTAGDERDGKRVDTGRVSKE